jgi:hypothetical protein
MSFFSGQGKGQDKSAIGQIYHYIKQIVGAIHESPVETPCQGHITRAASSLRIGMLRETGDLGKNLPGQIFPSLSFHKKAASLLHSFTLYLSLTLRLSVY